MSLRQCTTLTVQWSRKSSESGGVGGGGKNFGDYTIPPPLPFHATAVFVHVQIVTSEEDKITQNGENKTASLQELPILPKCN